MAESSLNLCRKPCSLNPSPILHLLRACNPGSLSECRLDIFCFIFRGFSRIVKLYACNKIHTNVQVKLYNGFMECLFLPCLLLCS
ncbi:hypothetical protein QVD17_26370 [Tagetes erecta]|uniref:Uncharacterized protein n=1 Tax=Tagetes erecta TaxID=13708 RepID=A0AAD8K6F1_TARER|nr:hypothetical protein QVD17_26370 [Tagetes erecta]